RHTRCYRDWSSDVCSSDLEMHSLFPPLIIEKVNTSAGVKQIALVAGISDNLYAIDADNGKLIWKKHFEYPTPERRGRPGDPLCRSEERRVGKECDVVRRGL